MTETDKRFAELARRNMLAEADALMRSGVNTRKMVFRIGDGLFRILCEEAGIPQFPQSDRLFEIYGINAVPVAAEGKARFGYELAQKGV